jgi:hypothetical protein
MATVKAAGYARASSSAQAGQPVINRHTWDVTAQADGDKVLIGVLPAGHRLHPEGSSLIANGATPAMTYDLCVGADANKVVTASAVTATTYKRDALATTVVNETIGVDFDNDRDIYLLLSDAPATGTGKVIATIASFPVSTAD